MNIELKTCPFCGGEAGKYADGQTAIVWCKNCDASIFDDNIINAVARWNRRTPDIKTELEAISTLLMQHTLTPYSEAMERILNLLKQL